MFTLNDLEKLSKNMDKKTWNIEKLHGTTRLFSGGIHIANIFDNDCDYVGDSNIYGNADAISKLPFLIDALKITLIENDNMKKKYKIQNKSKDNFIKNISKNDILKVAHRTCKNYKHNKNDDLISYSFDLRTFDVFINSLLGYLPKHNKKLFSLIKSHCSSFESQSKCYSNNMVENVTYTFFQDGIIKLAHKTNRLKK